jgi:RNA-binding protein YlmH
VLKPAGKIIVITHSPP